MAKVRRRFVRCEAPSCGQGKGAGVAPCMNPCVNALLTAYLAAPLRGVGFAVFVRLRGVYGRSGGGCVGRRCPVFSWRVSGRAESGARGDGGAARGARKL